MGATPSQTPIETKMTDLANEWAAEGWTVDSVGGGRFDHIQRLANEWTAEGWMLVDGVGGRFDHIQRLANELK
jgi:hypothetical protein